MPRIERRSRPISGMGGHLRITQRLLEPGGDYLTLDPFTGLLDVSRWQVRHKHIVAEVTHSGSLGAVKRTVVAGDFQFTASVPWNARMGVKTDTMVGSQDGVLLGFLEQILVGDPSINYSVGVEFYLGDPLHYVDTTGLYLPADPAFLAADEAIIEDFVTVCDATGKDVVRLDFMGWGNSVLRGYRGISPATPQLQFWG